MPGPGQTSGGGGSSAMMQMMLGVMQMKQQQKADDQRAAAEQVRNQQAGWQVISGIASKTVDPFRLRQLAKQGSQWGLGSEDDVLKTISEIQPDTETLKSFGAVQGIKQATGVPLATLSDTPESKILFGQAASRQLSGAGRGENAQSGYVADAAQTTPDMGAPQKTAAGNLMRSRWMTGGGLTETATDAAVSSIPDFNSVARKAFAMEHGFEMTAPQTSASQLGWAGLREQTQHNTVADANDATRAAAAGKAGGLGPQHLPDLFSTQQRMLAEMQSQTAALSPSDKLARLRSIRGINQTIREAGGYAPDFDENDALQKMHDPSAWDAFTKMITSKPSVRP
jgi:hypothetical protein